MKHWQCLKRTQFSLSLSLVNIILHTFIQYIYIYSVKCRPKLPSSFICRYLSRFHNGSITLDGYTRLVRDIPIVSHHHMHSILFIKELQVFLLIFYPVSTEFHSILYSNLCMPWSCNWFRKTEPTLRKKNITESHSIRTRSNGFLKFGGIMNKNQIDCYWNRANYDSARNQNHWIIKISFILIILFCFYQFA